MERHQSTIAGVEETKKHALCEGRYVGEAQSPIARVLVFAKSADLFRHLRGAGPAGVPA